MDVSHEAVIIEITGDVSKIESFTEMLRPIGILEMVRTGVVAMARGDYRMDMNGYHPQPAAVNGNGHKSVI